ncbi:MAG: hypothetical protein R3F65_17970 [bacterium]
MSDTTPDVRYADLIDEALTRIPALAPEWTDHNPSDPGIALLELSAWLVETVLYRSTRITDDGRRALLGLLIGQSPPEGLRGAELETAIRAAIRALRTPYRAVTPRDYHDRIREQWRSSPQALALGLDAAITGVDVFARRDLERDDPYAEVETDVSIVITPGALHWTHTGPLDPARPTLFLREVHPGALTLTAASAATAHLSGPSVLIYDGAIEAGTPTAIDLDAAALGESGELRLELDAAALDGGLDVACSQSPARRLTAPAETERGTLLGMRWVPIRRPGELQVHVGTATATPLRIELRASNNQVVAEATGEGVVSLRYTIAAASVTVPYRHWQLRLFAPEIADDEEIEAIDLRWDVLSHEEPARYADGGDALLDGVWSFLDPRRLLTVRHHVTAPRWRALAVSATVYLADGTDTDIAAPTLRAALLDRFPLPGRHGRPLGQRVHHSDVIAALEAVDGVDYVEDLVISMVDAPERTLVDDGEPYGIEVMPDEVLVPLAGHIDLTLYERS